MPEPNLIVYKGPTSQTGLATLNEFPDIDDAWKNEKYWKNKKFEHINRELIEETTLASLPMWNSHKGEIRFSNVLEMLFQKQIKLYSLWANLIVFECIVKDGIGIDQITKITSVHVAEEQCSQFIEERKAEFFPEEATTDAFKEFDNNPEINAALCAPGQSEGYEVLRDNVANPINFTTFAILGCTDSEKWTDAQWGSFEGRMSNPSNVYYGVQMPIRSVAFSDDQKTLFNDLTNEAMSIDEIPKIIFVTERTTDQCGLLIESSTSVLPNNILTEEGNSTEIEVIQDIGNSHSAYTNKIYSFLNDKLSQVLTYDFIKHGSAINNTCFFACPTLGIIIHGFEDKIVESVMRQVVDKYFELYVNGINCTGEQRAFFDKHIEDYYDKGSEFINFIDIGLKN